MKPRIRGGRRGRLYGVIACWTSCLLFYLFEGGRLSSMLLIVMSILCLYLLSGKWSGLSRMAIARQWTPETGEGPGAHCVAGGAIRVRLDVSMPGFWPVPYVVLRETLTGHRGERIGLNATFVPGWKRSGSLEYRIPPLRRGIYRFGETVCSTEDIFGLFEHRRTVHLDETLKVYPQTVPIQQWNRLFQPRHGMRFQQATLSRARRETTQINGVRDYVYGDKLSRIHWNATARTGVWKSKEFEREAAGRTLIVLDREAAAYGNKGEDRFELAVSICASILEHGLQRHYSIGLLSVGADWVWLDSQAGEASMDRIMDHLISVEADGRRSLADMLETHGAGIPRGSYLILVSPRPLRELARVVHWLEMKRIDFCHLWPSGAASFAASGFTGAGARVYPIRRLQDLPAVLGGNPA